MNQYRFTAFGLASELDLNRLGTLLGIGRKYRWEEPMLLEPSTLKPLAADRSREGQVYLYYFGAAVFLNCGDDVVRDFSRALGKTLEGFAGLPDIRYQDDYSLRIEAGADLAVTNDYAVMPSFERAFVDTIAFVLAKSVALERIEDRVDTVLDEVEGLIALLGQGRLGIPDKRLAQLAAKILDFKYRSIAYIMVLDKPDITWESPEVDRLYLTMANLFELSLRYQQIKHKSETLMDITGIFSDLSHARRASRLEWIIIALIFIEIVIYLFQIL
jgi:uncharacterized Rmd1/YagE family protein